MKEPTTDAGYEADLEKWCCEVLKIDENTFIVENSTGGQTRLEASDYSNALFEAWHLVKP